jgi:hypothetical protein
MSETTRFKRNPTIQCWIKHIFEGQYDENKRLFYTIFGDVKRIRIIATIIEKRENLIEQNDVDMGIEDIKDNNIRLDFNLDDSTGGIRAIIRNVNPDKYKGFNKGDLIEVTGTVSKYNDFISLWIEILKKVEEPNLILLRNAEIIDRIKHGEIHEIPKLLDLSDNKNELSDEIDVENLFESESDSGVHDKIKERIYSLVEEYSARGNGINFLNLKEKVKIPENDLRTYLKDLILESRIYESDNDIFEAF